MTQDDDGFLADLIPPNDPRLDALLGQTVRLERDEEPRIVVGILQFDDDTLDYVIVDKNGDELAFFGASYVSSIRNGNIYLDRSEITQEAINRAEEHGWDHPLL